MATQPEPGAERSLAAQLLSRATLLRPGEGRAALWAALYFFTLLCGYYILRPLRETTGIEGGPDKLPILYTGTLIGTVLVSPFFSFAVARWPRRVFVPLAYRFANANLLVFYLLFLFVPQGDGASSGWPFGFVHVSRVFFVWLSVFNLLWTSLYGGFLADVFSLEQSKRLFALAGVGGTLGAITGSWIVRRWAPEIGPVHLMVASMGLLELAVQCARRLGRTATRQAATPAPHLPAVLNQDESVIGGNAWAGVRSVLRSPYLQAISAYLCLQSLAQTFLYFEQAQIVDAAIKDRGQRAAFFASLNMWQNVLTLGLQLFVTGRLMQRLGLTASLIAYPLGAALCFGTLGMERNLQVIFAAQILMSGLHYAVGRPTRDALYTVVPREDKYKAKSFIDTFVYRGGDALAGWTFNGLEKALLRAGTDALAAIAWIALPLCAVWVAVAARLGRRQERIASLSPLEPSA